MALARVLDLGSVHGEVDFQWKLGKLWAIVYGVFGTDFPAKMYTLAKGPLALPQAQLASFETRQISPPIH